MAQKRTATRQLNVYLPVSLLENLALASAVLGDTQTEQFTKGMQAYLDHLPAKVKRLMQELRQVRQDRKR